MHRSLVSVTAIILWWQKQPYVVHWCRKKTGSQSLAVGPHVFSRSSETVQSHAVVHTAWLCWPFHWIIFPLPVASCFQCVRSGFSSLFSAGSTCGMMINFMMKFDNLNGWMVCQSLFPDYICTCNLIVVTFLALTVHTTCMYRSAFVLPSFLLHMKCPPVMPSLAHALSGSWYS